MQYLCFCDRAILNWPVLVTVSRYWGLVRNRRTCTRTCVEYNTNNSTLLYSVQYSRYIYPLVAAAPSSPLLPGALHQLLLPDHLQGNSQMVSRESPSVRADMRTTVARMSYVLHFCQNKVCFGKLMKLAKGAKEANRTKETIETQ